MKEGYLFRANRLSILVGSVHLLLSPKVHGGGFMGDFGVNKTEKVLATHLLTIYFDPF